MTKVKICGLKSIKDIEIANKYHPEFIGFIFAPGRKRTVGRELAIKMREALDPEIPAVGVFVDAPVSEVTNLLKDGIIQVAQLHGSEDAAYVASIKEQCDNPVVKAFVIRSKEDCERAVDFPCDYLLLDGGLGQGQTFDWSLIENIEKPFFLAGGLDASNVAEAIKMVHPFAVDVSSGVETDGTKDETKIRKFIEQVRA